MSKEAVAAFLKKVAEDAELQADLVHFALERGYEFTVEELSESELEAAAGGLTIGGDIKYISPTTLKNIQYPKISR